MAVNTRGFLSGIGGVVVVVLLGVLFARVLGGTGTNTRPSATAVASASPVATDSPTLSATALPTAFGSPTTGALTIGQAWGANAAKQTLTMPSDATHVFQATNITLDGTKLLGDELTFTANSKNSPGPSDARADFLDIGVGQITNIGLIPSTAGLLDRPGCCMTDGSFLVAEDSDAAGVTCGQCHIRVWSYDLQTGQPARLVTSSATAGGEIGSALLDHGILALSILNATTTFQFIDLTSSHMTTFVPGGGNQQASAPIMAFNWPYVIYAVATATSAGNDATRIYNVTTKSDIALPQGTTTGTIDSAVITGDTLFYSQGNTGIFEVDHFTTPGAQPHLLTTFTGRLVGVNARVLLIDNNSAGYLAWDRAEQHGVQLVAPSASNDMIASLSGDFLIVAQPATTLSPQQPQQVAIYDTAHLPQLVVP